MPNAVLTKKLVKGIAKHGEDALEQLDGLFAEKAVKWDDIHIPSILEHDFGPDYRRRIDVGGLDNDAMEAIISSSIFNKMILKTVRAALAETPKESYKLASKITAESKGECEGRYEDHGAFSDIQVHEVSELQKGPLYGLATDFQRHPVAKSYSAGLAWTREALCKDPNGYLNQQVPKLRDAHFTKQEELLLDAFIGYTASYDRSGTLYDTYYAEDGTSTVFDDGSSGPWVNSAALNFGCSADLQTVRNLFYDMRDLVHGRPIDIDTDNLELWTSKQKADAIRPKLLASAVESDEDCDATGTRHYVMSAEVANGMTFDLMSYQRLVDRIALRWDLAAADAQEWWFCGKPAEMFGFVWQIAPQITRCNISGDDQRRRIVALYDSLSKGYAYVKNPYKGVMLMPSQSAS